MNPQDNPVSTPAVSPPRRRRRLRRIAVAAAAFAALIIIISAAAGGGSSHATAASPAASTSAPAAPASSAASSSSAPAPAAPDSSAPDSSAPDSPPPPAPATKVTFVVTGTGGPSISYGSDSDNRSGAGTSGPLGDGVPLPWSGSVPFDGTALYYNVDAQLEGSGDITCKIVVTGPGDQPLTVATGHASGGYSICSAQAAPDNTDGTSWTPEG